MKLNAENLYESLKISQNVLNIYETLLKEGAISKVDYLDKKIAVQNIKLVSFEEKNKELKFTQISKRVTKNKFKKQISDIKNEKIKNSLIELSKVFKKK